jgi:hypothetical protein
LAILKYQNTAGNAGSIFGFDGSGANGVRMLRVFIKGGLGNQLFQYAGGLYLARRQKTDVVFHTDLLPEKTDWIGGVSRWPSQLSEFNGTTSVACRRNQPPGSTHLLSKILQLLGKISDLLPGLFVKFGILNGERNTSPTLSNLPKLRLIDSYLASPLPALALGQELRDQILDIESPSVEYLNLSREANSTRPIMIHVRLGDYLNLTKLFGEPQFDRIVDALKEANPEKAFPVWLFSDSPEVLSQSILSELGVSKVIGPEDLVRPIENLVLMSQGAALICSNSTFSWWAAFLMQDSDRVFYPELKNLPNKVFSGDLILKGWRQF